MISIVVQIARRPWFVLRGAAGRQHHGSTEQQATIRILASDHHVREVLGGLGAAKTTGNYTASLFWAEEAQKAGSAADRCRLRFRSPL